MDFPLRSFRIEKEWEAFGLKCVVVQNREGQNRCGYVQVPFTHSTYDMDYSEVNVNIHGGLTFGQKSEQGKWFGFDCAHYNDLIYDPDFDITKASEKTKKHFEIIKSLQFTETGHYWTHEEVVKETENLAEQLSKM